ncbi:hypothetical protein CR51_17275 [Caballeronia megalochromosomata]|nr:hypothetical protein CR51_17275 [Caballeronia megalochromosomata]
MDFLAQSIEVSPRCKQLLVDFSGLSRLETRAQCALVRQALLDRLSAVQACAIVARFSQIPSEKQAGVSGLVAHFSDGQTRLPLVQRSMQIRSLIRFGVAICRLATATAYRSARSRGPCLSKSALSRRARDLVAGSGVVSSPCAFIIGRRAVLANREHQNAESVNRCRQLS